MAKVAGFVIFDNPHKYKVQMVVQSATDISFDISDLRPVPVPGKILMTSPQYFSVEYVINPHMAGNIGTVNFKNAVHQWETLVRTYTDLGFQVEKLEGVRGLPDMVFCANQCLPFHDPVKNENGLFLSIMHADQRKEEVQYYREFFRRRNYTIHKMPASISNFEGMGDALWHSGRFLLWGGYGFRSDLKAYEFISDEIGVDVIALSLSDPDFYHLDTCLSMLTEDTCLVYREAFDERGLELIDKLFDNVISAPEDEARKLFAVNAHCPDGKNVILQMGCDVTGEKLQDAGLNPVFVDTSEYIKSGGSVFCMKQAYW